ncbi:hypothetical protein [Methylocaldum sp.]|uniref:hypothetical protein n=1 Tax=Methylocaldum sp. TaxID=1969727 RepID=UPI002D6EA148|nr:hypothetical protein [Methylocaldum sp.]HYE35297.1 hypothetical protein [Methylocaldum sp.]
MREGISVRLAIFGRHVGQSTAACLTAMTKGDLASVTLQHWQIALTTGLAAGVFGVLVSLGPLIKFYDNKWTTAAIAFFGTVIADRWSHPSHFGGPWSEALVTAFGAAALCLLLSYTPIGKAIEKLEKPEPRPTSDRHE